MRQTLNTSCKRTVVETWTWHIKMPAACESHLRPHSLVSRFVYSIKAISCPWNEDFKQRACFYSPQSFGVPLIQFHPTLRRRISLSFRYATLLHCIACLPIAWNWDTQRTNLPGWSALLESASWRFYWVSGEEPIVIDKSSFRPLIARWQKMFLCGRSTCVKNSFENSIFMEIWLKRVKSKFHLSLDAKCLR